MAEFEWLTADLDEMHAELLRRSRPGRKILADAHQAMAEVVAKRVFKAAPRDRTPPRSSASVKYGPLSKMVEIEADDEGAVLVFPFYARFQRGGAYVLRAVEKSMPAAVAAYGKVVGKAVGRPGGGFLPEPAARAAVFGEAALNVGLGVAGGFLGLHRGRQVGAFAGGIAQSVVQGAVTGGIGSIGGTIRAGRVAGAAQRSISGFRGSRLGRAHRAALRVQDTRLVASDLAFRAVSGAQAVGREAVAGPQALRQAIAASRGRGVVPAARQVQDRARRTGRAFDQHLRQPLRGSLDDISGIWG